MQVPSEPALCDHAGCVSTNQALILSPTILLCKQAYSLRVLVLVSELFSKSA